MTASRIELARTALSTVLLTRALALAQWTGASRELTTTGVLRPAVAVEACRMLGIDVPSGKLRSAKDVPDLNRAWAVALAADLVQVTANRASTAPGVAELVTRMNKAGKTAELDDDLAERVVLALTPLGRLLAEAVFGSISPPADDTAEDLVTAVAWMPPAVALAASGPWLAARAPHAAVRELLDFAAAFDGPVLRSVALEIAREMGADAMPVWREYARMPGFGAYARQWLAAQDEPVAADDKDGAWLLVDTIVQSGGQPTPEMLPLLSGTSQAVGGGSADRALAGIADCGHPHAADVMLMLSGGPAAGLRTPAEKDTLYQLKVTLRGVSKPPVWRRVLVHAAASLGELHHVIIAAMGWDGGHLHMFSDNMAHYYGPDGEDEDEDEFAIGDVLVEPGERLRYLYDFGDEWDHDIRLEKIFPPDADLHGSAVPVCLAGKGACPPEDCGGDWGYANLKEVIADPSDEEHEERLEWLGLEDPSEFDPAAFDLASVNARLHGPV